MLKQIAKTLERHRSGLLAYYDYPISTGPLEGTNNKIKTMKRQAYGFRDHEFFKLKIHGYPRGEVRFSRMNRLAWCLGQGCDWLAPTAEECTPRIHSPSFRDYMQLHSARSLFWLSVNGTKGSALFRDH